MAHLCQLVLHYIWIIGWMSQCGLVIRSHESLIKSCHVEARQILGLQCKLWPEPNAWLPCQGQDGRGDFFCLGRPEAGLESCWGVKMF